MQIVVIPGILLALIGLAGICWCIWQASTLRKGGLDQEAARRTLRRLNAVNMASVGLAFLGLAAVAVGLILS